MEIHISDSALRDAARGGMDNFITYIGEQIAEAAGGTLSAESIRLLNAEQTTLWAYLILRDEVMDGGFVQLIHNGYGPFFFLNPFAKAMRLWGLKDLSKLIYRGRELFEENGEALTRECSDEEFMALFEQYPEYDDLDDEFVENEEHYSNIIAQYVDDHLEAFIHVTDD